MVISLARYLVRMRGRATPFGAFAGVAALRFGPRVSARWTDAHQARTRADAVWLAAVIASLESCPALRRRLPVTVNDLVVVRGERLVVPWQPGAGDPDGGRSVEVSVRYNPPVQTLMQAARSPIQVGDLIDKVAAEFPAAAVSAIDAMVAELVARGVLITSLRPPSTSTDGLAHVLHQLQEVDAAALREAAGLVGELRAIHAQLQAADRGDELGRGTGQAGDGRADAGAVDRCRAAADGGSAARCHDGVAPAGGYRSRICGGGVAETDPASDRESGVARVPRQVFVPVWVRRGGSTRAAR